MRVQTGLPTPRDHFERQPITLLGLEGKAIDVSFRFDTTIDTAWHIDQLRVLGRAVVHFRLLNQCQIGDQQGHRIRYRVAQRKGLHSSAARRVGGKSQRVTKILGNEKADQLQFGRLAGGNRQRKGVGYERPIANLDAVFPVLIPLVANVANLEQVITLLFEHMTNERIAEEEVVRGGKCHAGRSS